MRHFPPSPGIAAIFVIFLAASCAMYPSRAAAQTDELATAAKENAALTAREKAVKSEEERIRILGKGIDARIEQYSKLLARIEEVLTRLEAAKNERMDHIVKAYEAMQQEEAAARLAALDEDIAVKILIRMKSKKAGALMGLMDAEKAVTFTERMTAVTKKFPTP